MPEDNPQIRVTLDEPEKILKLAEWWSPHEPLKIQRVLNIAVRLIYEQEARARDYWGRVDVNSDKTGLDSGEGVQRQEEP